MSILSKKTQMFSIPCVIYPVTIIVASGYTSELDLQEELKKFGIEQDEIYKTSRAGCFSFLPQKAIGVVQLSDAPKCHKTIATLSHEMFHAAYRILSHVGVSATGSSEEAYAYLLGYLVSESLKKY